MELTGYGLASAGFVIFAGGGTTVFHWILASSVTPQPLRIRGIWTADGVWTADAVWYA